jgi:hypothetical protein
MSCLADSIALFLKQDLLKKCKKLVAIEWMARSELVSRATTSSHLTSSRVRPVTVM